MTFNIITLFPEIFESVFSQSIIKKAQSKGQITINFTNPRDFATDKHKTVDDKPYGGGAGMIMKVDILHKAISSISPKPYVILLDASGKTYDQKIASNLAKKKNVAIICGHYEGVDARVKKYVNETVSIGNFILTGGEIAAMALIDSISRLIPGVINPKSLEFESFSQTIVDRRLTIDEIEYPQYTRPEEFLGLKVPKILLSGDHQKIAEWRTKNSKKKL